MLVSRLDIKSSISYATAVRGMEVFFWPKHIQVAVILFSHNLLTRSTKFFFLGGGGQKHLIIEEWLTDLMVVLGAVLTDVDHMTPQHRQTTYKVLDSITERITLVTRKNILWGRKSFTPLRIQFVGTTELSARMKGVLFFCCKQR